MKYSFSIHFAALGLFISAVYFRSNSLGLASIGLFFIGIIVMAYEAWVLFLGLPKIDMTGHDMRMLSNLDQELMEEHLRISSHLQLQDFDLELLEEHLKIDSHLQFQSILRDSELVHTDGNMF